MWFIFTLVSIFSWGTADLFYKKSSNPKDPYSHLRIVIMVGSVMGIHALYTLLFTDISYDPMNIIRYLPVSSMYILSMTIGYIGLRYIELSVSSPIMNSSGAIASLLTFIFLGQVMTGVQFFAVAVISVGILLLSIFEKRAADLDRIKHKEKVDRKYQIGALAILLPILYAIIDGLGTFADAFILDKVMSENQANTSYELTFLICAILAAFYLLVVKKKSFNLFEERTKGYAAIFETIGQFFYVYAIAGNAIIVSPLISSYSIVSVILSRIFLKEKLTKAQYWVIAAIMVGIFILGFE
ncbi:DMT family transporter [Carnobacterium funditum]|uniref:DMT family transporter n=1 Tax=Carnobacterium funditum TaxID=2752 RepID=UPI00054F2A40|nr:DMT family transporter [Carnobacterium funditum]